MAANRGVNFVRYFFYDKCNFSSEMRKSLVALAYATARDLEIAPTAVLIRSALHRTTTSAGQHIIDPEGWHVTIAFKTRDQDSRAVHVASHGYTNGQHDYTLKSATHASEKADSTPKGRSKPAAKDKPKMESVVWPSEQGLEEYEDSPIAYSHIPEKNS